MRKGLCLCLIATVVEKRCQAFDAFTMRASVQQPKIQRAFFL